MARAKSIQLEVKNLQENTFDLIRPFWEKIVSTNSSLSYLILPPSTSSAVKFAKIVGSAEIHVKVGSTIALTCVVNHQVPSIQW